MTLVTVMLYRCSRLLLLLLLLLLLQGGLVNGLRLYCCRILLLGMLKGYIMVALQSNYNSESANSQEVPKARSDKF